MSSPTSTVQTAVTSTPEEDKKKIGTNTTGNPKRQKIVKACKDCRRRKVKCDGATPCGTCRRSSIQCIFESTSPKRGTSKHYIESLENRLFVMEKAMNSLGGTTAQLIKDAVRREEEQQALLKQQQQQTQQQVQQQDHHTFLLQQEEDRYLINEFGSPNYIEEMNQSFYQTSSSASPKSISSEMSTINSSNSPKLTENGDIDAHLKYYLIQIQPYFPLFVPTLFNRQYQSNELPMILIYSMCALSCLYQQLDDNTYYQKAIIMLDESIGKPSISLVQTLLILIKYKEHEPQQQYGYFEKAKSYMARTIEMVNILKLNMPLYFNANNDTIMMMLEESRKRTFSMVFTYHTLLCVEQGLPAVIHQFSEEQLPSTILDESTIDSARYVIKFTSILNIIHQYILRITKRQELQKEFRDEQQIIEENMSLFNFQVKIENELIHLPSNLNYMKNMMNNMNQFPAEDILITISPLTRTLHLILHLNIMLLHYHYAKYPLPISTNVSQEFTQYPHLLYCSSSASQIIRLVEGLLSDPSQSFRYSPRGLQLISHVTTFAYTILQQQQHISKVYQDEFSRCQQLMTLVVSFSPSVEMRLSLLGNKVPPLPSQQQVQVPGTMMRRNSTSNYHVPLNNIHSQPLHIPSTTAATTAAQQSMIPKQLQIPVLPQIPMQLSPQQMSPQQRTPPHHVHMLRGSTQSCGDLKSLNQLHQDYNSFTQHRKPVASVISSSTTSTNPQPYRHTSAMSPTLLPYGKPIIYDQPMAIQSSQSPSARPGKMKRIKKSQSIHGISQNYRQQQQYMMPVQQQQQQLFQQQQMHHLLTSSSTQLHRPYQPTLEDYSSEMFLFSNYNNQMDLQRSEGHHLF